MATDSDRLRPSKITGCCSSFFIRRKFGSRAPHQVLIIEYSDVIRLDPTLAQVHLLRGHAYYNIRDFDNAIADYTEGLRREPALAATYHLSRGNAHYSRSDFVAAIKDYDETIGRGNGDVGSYRFRGRSHLMQGSYAAASKDLTEAINLGATDTSAYLDRAEAFRSQNLYEAACNDYSEVLRQDPKNAWIYYMRGSTRRKLAPFQLAKPMIDDFTEAIRLNPDLEVPYRERAEIYCANAKYNEAIADCTKAIQLFPTAQAYKIRSLSTFNQQSKGDLGSVFRGFITWHSGALSDASEAIRLDPNDAEAWMLRGALHKYTRYNDKALADMTEAIRLNPLDPKGYEYRAVVYRALGNTTSAQADFAEAERLKSNK